MKFNFDHISYADLEGYSILKDKSSKRSNAERTERVVQANKLLKTFLTEPRKGLYPKDSVSDFYSDLASPSTQKRHLAINKNTADRHGRT